MRHLVLLLVAVAVLASCGGDPETTPGATGPPATPAGALSASSTAAPSTTTPSTTAPSTTPASSTVPSTIATTTTTTQPPDAASWAAPGFPEARPPEAIPWDQIGSGWLLIRYRQALESWEEIGPQALFLVDPAGTTYAVAMWPNPGLEILAWSPEGRRIATFNYSTGALQVIDLTDGGMTVVKDDLIQAGDQGSWVSARFTRPTGRDLVVRVLEWDRHVTLDCLRTDGTIFSHLADLDLSTIDPYSPDHIPVGITWLYASEGTEVVVADGDGIRLLTNLGATVRRLDTPGTGCTLSRWWDQGGVLASCTDPDWAASACWGMWPGSGRSLWAVPIDGSAATRLTPAPQVDPDAAECREPWAPGHVNGLAAGGVVAAQTSGCCECGGSVVFFSGETERPWAGADEATAACSPELIAVSPGGNFLILDVVMGWDPDHGATGALDTILEVSPDGAMVGALTPLLIGYYGGVIQVLTTAEEVG